MDWTIPLVAGLYGLLIGSFLNVCSLRWPVDESVVHPRSRCPKCETLIVWYDNVPVFSWLLLRGQCRSCAAPVSPQYPMVEAATGLMWAAMFVVHGPTWEAFRGAIFLTIIFGISISDARFYIIPDEFSIGGTVIGLGMAFLVMAKEQRHQRVAGIAPARGKPPGGFRRLLGHAPAVVGPARGLPGQRLGFVQREDRRHDMVLSGAGKLQSSAAPCDSSAGSGALRYMLMRTHLSERGSK